MAFLSIATSIATLALKFGAYFITDSVSLLSDALEALVNLAAGLVALTALTIAEQPADDRHSYGHDKAEYFSIGVEGTLILFAAASIIFAGWNRFMHPAPLENLGWGIGVGLLAAAMNFTTARLMLDVAAKHDSVTIEADAKHLLTDVWTSIGVVAGVGATVLTGWLALDPLIAIAVAVNIVWTGAKVMRRSVLGLMDRALPEPDLERIRAILEPYRVRGLDYHALRTRRAGRMRLVDMHLLVPGEMSVREGHRIADEIEDRIRGALPGCAVLTYLEPIEDPASYRDQELFR